MLAERALETARAAGDLRRTVTALTDLGVALLREGDTPRAAAALEEACAEAERLGDRALMADAASNLALAASSMGQPLRARSFSVRCWPTPVPRVIVTPRSSPTTGWRWRWWVWGIAPALWTTSSRP